MGNFAGKDDSGEMDDMEQSGHGGHVRQGGQPQRGGPGDPRQVRAKGQHPHITGPFASPGRPRQQGGVGVGVGLGGDGGGMVGSPSMDMVMAVDDEDREEDLVTTVFKWEHGGRQVYIQGTFNNWERQIPMHRSGNDFTYICNLKRGKHAFKFIVDDEWRFAPDQLTVADVEGRINNFIDVTHFRPFNEESSCLDIARKADESYSQVFPDLEDYSLKEPPNLPPHLRHIILNKVTNERDPLVLPVPQHVALDHLYCTAIKDGMMVLATTQRYKQKFVSTVYYSLMP